MVGIPWLSESLIFKATGSSAVVDFSVFNQVNDIGLDRVSVAATPLPATWTMMLIGLMKLGLLACRRHKQEGALPAV